MEAIFTFPIIPRRYISGQGIGEYPGQRRGQGHDFIDKRRYEPADPTRIIDWKETAKRSAQRRSFSPYVRQFRQDEIMRAVIVVDRSPRMSWYPTPWLSKSKVIVSAGQMIVDSLKKYHSLIGYLDYANWKNTQQPFWRPPNRETEADRVRNRNLCYENFTAPENNIDMALEQLLSLRSQVPPESFIFLLSDFLVMPNYNLMELTVATWDVIPIIIQDPILEASFPVWRGKLPLYLPQVFSDGQRQSVAMSAKDAKRKRAEHENRLKKLIKLFEDIRVRPITLFSSEPEQIFEAFSQWSSERYRQRGGWRL